MFPVELGGFAAEVRVYVWHGLLHAFQVPGAWHRMPVFGDDKPNGYADVNTVSKI
jgi:hypothetical protein